MAYVTDDEHPLTPEQVNQVVIEVQKRLLEQARRGITLEPPARVREIIPEYEDDFTCCGTGMEYRDFFGVRRYRCIYRHHDAIFVSLVTGEQVRDD